MLHNLYRNRNSYPREVLHCILIWRQITQLLVDQANSCASWTVRVQWTSAKLRTRRRRYRKFSVCEVDLTQLFAATIECRSTISMHTATFGAVRCRVPWCSDRFMFCCTYPGRGEVSTHPVSSQVVHHARKHGIAPLRDRHVLQRVQEVGFEPERCQQKQHGRI